MRLQSFGSITILFRGLNESLTYRWNQPRTKLVLSLAILSVMASSISAAASVITDVTVSHDQGFASSNIKSPKFSTHSSGELLLAFIATDQLDWPNTTVSSLSGGGLTWVLVKRTNAQPGSAEIWRAFAPNPLDNIRVTASLSQSVVASITVSAFSGVAQTGSNGSGAIGATGSSQASQGAPSSSLVTTQSDSVVVGVGNDYSNAIARQPSTGQTVVHQDLSPTGDTYWVQRIAASTLTEGAKVQISDIAPTSDQYNLSICEILPSRSGPELSVSSPSLSFGSITDGTAATQTLLLKSTGTSPLTITSESIAGSAFSISSGSVPMTLTPGASASLILKFVPQETGSVTGSLVLNTNSSTAQSSSVELSGIGLAASSPALALSTPSLSFGSVTDGSTKSLSLTLTSDGTSPLTVSRASIAGTGFDLGSVTLPATLAVGQSLTIPVQFAPVASGAVTGSVTIHSNATQNNSAAVALSGTATSGSNGKLSLSSTTLSFGSVTVGSTATKTITMTSTGTSSVAISSCPISGAGFVLMSGSCSTSLTPGATDTLTIAFDPTADGASTGTLSVKSNASTALSASLSGTGSGAPTYSVDLSWAAPTTSPDPVAGYHVYRSTGGNGSYSLLSTSTVTGTDYVDSKVVASTVYDYLVKSVDASGNESIDSNQISVTTP